jgi:hypothetical protein
MDRGRFPQATASAGSSDDDTDLDHSDDDEGEETEAGFGLDPEQEEAAVATEQDAAQHFDQVLADQQQVQADNLAARAVAAVAAVCECQPSAHCQASTIDDDQLLELALQYHGQSRQPLRQIMQGMLANKYHRAGETPRAKKRRLAAEAAPAAAGGYLPALASCASVLIVACHHVYVTQDMVRLWRRPTTVSSGSLLSTR